MREVGEGQEEEEEEEEGWGSDANETFSLLSDVRTLLATVALHTLTFRFSVGVAVASGATERRPTQVAGSESPTPSSFGKTKISKRQRPCRRTNVRHPERLLARGGASPGETTIGCKTD